VIHYHGGPITPQTAAIALWTRRHAMVSFARPDQMALAAEICQSFALDNGAFSLWRAGEGVVDVVAFADWVRQWERHPGYDFALIPDAIDGDEAVNDGLIARWHAQRVRSGVPVWHLHERLERLDWLVRCTESRVYPLVALGSSGAFAKIGTDAWWGRIAEAMTVACDDDNTAVADAPDRACGHCGLANTPEGHDGCLGTLREVTNACCGHGRGEEAYVVLDDGTRLAGVAAIEFFQSALVSVRGAATGLGRDGA
jgi:hypothetical protein